jgi:hypothetical protein
MPGTQTVLPGSLIESHDVDAVSTIPAEPTATFVTDMVFTLLAGIDA